MGVRDWLLRRKLKRTPLPPIETLKIWKNEKDGSDLVTVPGGPCVIGKNGSKLKHINPEHVVEVPQFNISLTCVTMRQYCRFLNETQAKPEDVSSWVRVGKYSDKYQGRYRVGDSEVAIGGIIEEAGEFQPYKLHHFDGWLMLDFSDLPVILVSWYGAAAYCEWAGLRLPSALEWEKAARGIGGRTYPWGNEWKDPSDSPYDGPSYQWGYDAAKDGWAWHHWSLEHEHMLGRSTYTCDVRACNRGRSAYGCYNMCGNVWEWCNDSLPDGRRVKRGWSGDSSDMMDAEYLAMWVWYATEPTSKEPMLGFRPARSDVGQVLRT